MTALPLGKTPATYDKRDLRFSDIRAGINLPPIPKPTPGWGYGMDFGPANWLMLGNGPCDDNSVNSSWAAYSGAGDCVWAGAAHETMESQKNASRLTSPFTCLNVLKQYGAYSGYNLQSGVNDNGSNVRDVLSWRRTKGLFDARGGVHKIGVFVSVEPTNLTDLWEALYLFEAVGIGINFPSSAMDQFAANQMWSVVNGAQIEGGHYIPLFGHPADNVWTCVTWGKRQTMTANFIKTYCDEAWAFITAERYNAITGKTLQGYKDADLEQFITLVGKAA